MEVPDSADQPSTGEPAVEIADMAERARTQVALLLSVAGIQTVVCVDDNFEPELAVILDAIGGADEEVSVKVSASLGISLEGDVAQSRPIWALEVEEAWLSLSDDEKRRYASRVMCLLEETNQPDAGHLGDFLPAEVTFLPITAPEWMATVQPRVLAEQTGRTLVLFDRAHGDDQNLGIRLAADLHEADGTGTVWAGLLTHTVSPADEIEQGPVLAAQDPRIVPERFVVISKQHLESTPSTLPHGLKVTLMSPAAHRLRSAVGYAITDGADEAASKLKLDPYEFERAIFTTAATEGIWEPDMLLRLFNVLIRAEVHKTLYSSAQIANDASLLRRFSAVDLEPNENQSFAAARSIRHSEIYEDPAHLNGRHLPIELGDIFEIGDDPGSAKTVILVEQPCDLMVRSKSGAGKRSNSLTHAHVLELKPEAHGQYAFTVPSYNEDASWYAWLGKLIMVPFEVLDLCVYEEEGKSRLDTEAVTPAGLWPAWEARYAILLKEARKLVSAVTGGPLMDIADTALRAELIKNRCVAHFGIAKPVQCVVDGSVVEFNVRRVNRLLAPYNRALLGEHSSYRARADFEPDFPTG